MNEAQVKAKVSQLDNLTNEQRAIVAEIAVASIKKHRGLQPNIEGIANLFAAKPPYLQRNVPTQRTTRSKQTTEDLICKRPEAAPRRKE